MQCTSKAFRFQRQYDAQELVSKKFLDADLVTSFEELKEKLNAEENLPENIFKISSNNKLTIYSIVPFIYKLCLVSYVLCFVSFYFLIFRVFAEVIFINAKIFYS